MKIIEKLHILSDSAKYDVSCASSKSQRSDSTTKASGICHSFTSDGRCVSLLKILLTNVCIYDCSYCINRNSNDIPRAIFKPKEVAKITMDFYRRNFIEGLFLSSGIVKSPDYTMELILRVLEILRIEESFKGYIHAKIIPNSNPLLIQKVLDLADRISTNIELATDKHLKALAPQKEKKAIDDTFNIAKNHALHVGRKFSPMSTQLMVGATDESDYEILDTAQKHYQNKSLARVYYSAYIPINTHKNLPTPNQQPPLLREHRLYQADWLLRFYNFSSSELLDKNSPNLNLAIDPKLSWALQNLQNFPIDIDKAPFHTLIKIPGIGHKGAWKIINARKYRKMSQAILKNLNISTKKARFFIIAGGKYLGENNLDRTSIENKLLSHKTKQLSLFDV